MLIFKDRSGIYTAKIADFGLSTYFYGEKDLVQMPESVPWNAPEHHNRYFCPQDAKAMDVYSFSMLCLWLLFGVGSSETIPYSLRAADDTGLFSFEAGDWSQKGDLLRSWKRDRLLDWTVQLMVKPGNFGTKIRENLTQFFRSTLCFNHQARVTDWSHILSLLAPAQ